MIQRNKKWEKLESEFAIENKILLQKGKNKRVKINQLEQFPLAAIWNSCSWTVSKFAHIQVRITQNCPLKVQTISHWDGAFWSLVVPGVKRCTPCLDRHTRSYSSIIRRTDLFLRWALIRTCICIKSVPPRNSQKKLAVRFLRFSCLYGATATII